MQFFTSACKLGHFAKCVKKEFIFFSNFFLVLPLVFFQSEMDQVSFGCTITPPPHYIFYSI